MASFPFIPKGQEDLKWHQPAPKPRFQRLMENGVFYFQAQAPIDLGRLTQPEPPSAPKAPQHEKIRQEGKIFLEVVTGSDKVTCYHG